MKSFYVHVVGSYDDTFVGPFADEALAKKHADAAGQRGFVTLVMTDEQYIDNLRAFGPANLEEPVSP